MRLRIRVDGEPHEVLLERGRVVVDGQSFDTRVEGDAPFEVHLDGQRHTVRLLPDGVEVDGERLDVHVATLPPEVGGRAASGAGPVHPPLPGRIASVRVRPGDKVAAGQVLVVLEAMKMQNEVAAPAEGIVREVRVKEGQLVEAKDILVVLG